MNITTNINGIKNSDRSILKEFEERVGFTHKNIFDEPLPDFKVTEETKEITKAFAKRCRGSVRLRTGLFYTKEGLEKERKRLQSVKMP